jgi:hypothetical protein
MSRRRSEGRGRTRAGIALCTVLILSALALPAQAQTPRSGGTVVSFLAAVDRHEIDAALALLHDEVVLIGPYGDVWAGGEAVRQFLEDFPRPIHIRDRRPLGRGRYEAHICAGGTPLHLSFRGINGLIAEILIMHEPESAASMGWPDV